MSVLSNLLQAANTEHVSARAIARKAQIRGYTLNHDTAARYLRGTHGKPDEATLLALADVLAVPMKQLRTAAGLPHELTEPYSPPAEASRLTRRQRRAVDEVIRAMLEPGSAAAQSPGVSELSERARAPRRAARRGSAEPPER